MINGNDAVSTRPLPIPQPAERCGKVRVGPCDGAELAEVDLAVVVGVVSAGHAKMLNTVKDKNRGSQSDRARPSVPMFSTVSPNIVAIYQGLVG